MNPWGLKRSVKIWCKVIGLVIVFGFIFFATPSVKGEETRIGSTGKSEQSGHEKGAAGAQQDYRYDLPSIIRYALKNNPNLKMSGKDIEIEEYEISAAKANRMPKIDLGGGVTRFRYDTPLTPAVIMPPIGAGTEFPVYRRTIWDAGVSFRLPLFKGGRLYRAVNVTEIKKAIAEDFYMVNRQELIYNLTSVYCKIVQLEKLLLANEQTVRQLESHKKNVELFLQTGAVARIDLLKTDVELSHAMERKLVVKNNLAGTYELLRALMGMDNMDTEISIIPENKMNEFYPTLEESMNRAFSQRPDYKAIAKKKLIAEERIKIAEGKRLPDVFAAGEYVARAGHQTSFKENWNYGVRFSVPLFDGGLIRSEINKEKAGLEKVKEEERALRLLVNREVKDAHLQIANARERIEVTGKAIESAKENARVEALKYNTGTGTSTDVIDAQTALLRAEIDYYQAIFDREAAFAYLKKAIGEDEYDREGLK